jgi:hypothetical protein
LPRPLRRPRNDEGKKVGLAMTFLRCLCEEPAGDEAISWHYVTNGQIAAPFGLAMGIILKKSWWNISQSVDFESIFQ